MMFRRRQQDRICPRCRNPLISEEGRWICARCLLIWRGDTFEPLTQELLGSASRYEYFFLT